VAGSLIRTTEDVLEKEKYRRRKIASNIQKKSINRKKKETGVETGRLKNPRKTDKKPFQKRRPYIGKAKNIKPAHRGAGKPAG